MRYLSNRKVPFKRHYQTVSFVFLFLFKAQKAQQGNITGDRGEGDYGLLSTQLNSFWPFDHWIYWFTKSSKINIPTSKCASCIFLSFCVCTCITNVFATCITNVFARNSSLVLLTDKKSNETFVKCQIGLKEQLLFVVAWFLKLHNAMVVWRVVRFVNWYFPSGHMCGRQNVDPRPLSHI